MTRFEDLLGKSGDAIDSLSETERSRMRTLLAEYASFKPVRNAAPSSTARFLSFALTRPAVAAALAFALVATSGGAVAYAAEGTVPGDLLYPVKVDVTEPVVTALVPTGKAQVDWQLAIAKRRLNEAATLSAKGRLASSTAAMLAARAADATLTSAQDASKLSAAATSTASSTDSIADAVQLLAQGEDRLKAHDDAGAARAFTAAIQAAAKAEGLMHAAAMLDLGLLDESNASSTSEDAGPAASSTEASSTEATTTSWNDAGPGYPFESTSSPEGSTTGALPRGTLHRDASTTATSTDDGRLRTGRSRYTEENGDGEDRFDASTTVRIFDW